MRTSSLVATVVASLAVGVGLGWVLFGSGVGPFGERRAERKAVHGTGGEEPREAPAVPGGTAAPEGGAILRGDAQGRMEDLEAENRRLAAKVAEMEAAEARRKAPPPGSAGAFRFGVADTATSFEAADWKALGGHIRGLAPVLGTLSDEIAKGGKPSSATSQAIGEHNLPLAAFALSLGRELSGTGGNGPFTHPAVLANLMRAVLQEAGDPLTAEQEAAIRTLGEAAARELNRVLESTAGLAISRTYEEVETKDRFVRAVRDLLTPSQQALLFPPATVGRVGLDVLSPGLVWSTLRDDVTAKTREELENRMASTFFDYAGFDPPDVEAWKWVFEEWVEKVPGALDAIPSTSPDALFPRLDVVQAAARAQAAAIERLLSRGSWSEEQVKGLKGVLGLVHPQLVAP